MHGHVRMGSIIPWSMSCQRARAAPSPRLLIVEENQRLRAAVTALLADRALSGSLAADGTAVIRQLTHAFEDHHPTDGVDLVVVDVDSAGRSGLDILATARERRWPVRVVLTSTAVGPSLRAAVLRMGAAALLPRPLTAGGWRSLLRAVT
jgi:DNA-binding response OmpR family regulator